MDYSMMLCRHRTYMEFVTAWRKCTHFGNIISRVDRINDVLNYLVELGLTDLIPYLLINEKTNAFIYKADLGRKKPIQIVEIYRDTRPRATEWRERYAQIALRIDEDLVDGLDDNVAIPEFVVPLLDTALEEVMLIH